MPGIPQFIGGSEDVKAGIASAAYDPIAIVDYTYGNSFDNARASAPATLYYWTDDDQGIGNSDGAHYFAGNRFDVTPGRRSITEITMWSNSMRDTHVSALYIEVWRDDDTNWTKVAGSDAIAPLVGSDVSEYMTVTPAAPVEFTVEEGKVYYVGVRVVRKAVVGLPGFYGTTGLTFAYNHLRFAVKATSWNGDTVSQADVANESYSYNATAGGLLQRITYTSDQFTEQDHETIEGKSYWLAKSVTEPYIVKLEGVVVPDTSKLTAVLNDVDGYGATLVRSTSAIDMGNTTPGTNVITSWAHDVSLPDITQNSITYGQEGCTFDLWWGIRMASAGREDLYWQNRTLEFGIHAHAVAYSGTRGTLNSTTKKASILTLSGTFTGSKLRVGIKPMVLIGDSQTISGYFASLRYPSSTAWGAMSDELPKKHIWILGGQAGLYQGYVSASTPGIKEGLIKNTTPGVADAVEMAGSYSLRCLWMVCGLGVNDAIGTSTLTSNNQAEMRASDMLSDLALAIADLVAVGEFIAIAGLPPTSKTGTADQYDGRAVRLYNRALLGLSLTIQCPFYNPWPDMVQRGTENDTLPIFQNEYTSDEGTHYSPAGGLVVRPKWADSVMAGTIDIRDSLA